MLPGLPADLSAIRMGIDLRLYDSGVDPRMSGARRARFLDDDECDFTQP